MKLIQGPPNERKKIWIYLWWAEIELLDAYVVCPWGLCCAFPNVMRLMSASEINLITICKYYSRFPNWPGRTLEACVYIHTHELKTKLNADASVHVKTFENFFLQYLFCPFCNWILQRHITLVTCPKYVLFWVVTMLWRIYFRCYKNSCFLLDLHPYLLIQ